MTKIYGARIVLRLSEKFAEAVLRDGLFYSQDAAFDPLKDALAKQKAELHNALRDFEYYVQSSQAHGVDDNPIVNWTRDATQNPYAVGKYSGLFTIAVGGHKVFERDFAMKFAKALKPLEGQGVVELVRVDSMDPSKNPTIPEKYFTPKPKAG